MRPSHEVAIVVAPVLLALLASVARAEMQPGVVRSEFIYDKARFPECHASTIVSTKDGLVAAWFGGTEEGSRDVNIWVSRHDGKSWSPVAEAARGDEPDGRRYPCWNPVLFEPKEGPLLLFYKVGPSPSRWWGVKRTSSDGGKSWSAPERLPDGILGPVKNKPVQLADGTLLSGSSTENAGWRVHMERSTDGGKTWNHIGPLNDGREFAAIQPTVLPWAADKIQILCRSRQEKVVESWSTDGGKTFSPLKATSLPNPNAGLDAVHLADGRALLVYNHTVRAASARPRDREMLNVAVSRDGRDWQAALTLENQSGEYSYPAVIQSPDGLVHITYTYDRKRIKHVVVDPAKLVLRPIKDGKWPAD
ncbi:MAG: sialidase family protein [Pirellulales bacterium]